MKTGEDRPLGAQAMFQGAFGFGLGVINFTAALDFRVWRLQFFGITAGLCVVDCSLMVSDKWRLFS